MKATKFFQIFSIKKMMGLLLIAGATMFSSCEGPIGPQGPEGETIIGSVFELHGDFTPGNQYTLYTQFPSNIIVYDTDVVLVYILWDVVDGMDVWRLCPQTVVLDNGVIQYNFDYTYNDVQVFLEFTVPEYDLEPAETENQIFRIAILPADDVFADGSLDISNFDNLLEIPKLELNMLDRVDINSISK